MKKVAIVTSTRAEYGLFFNLIKRLEQNNNVEFSLIVTGTHLSQNHGYTLKEILDDKIKVDYTVDILSDTNEDTIKIYEKTISGFSNLFNNIYRPDLVVVLGDRFEIFAVASVCMMLQIPIAHLCGGDTTFGAIDEVCRHCITKMSSLHFTGNKVMRNRVIQLGEQPDHVFNVGEPCVENMLNLQTISLEELSEYLNFDITSSDYAVVTFHPVTTEKGKELVQLDEMLKAFDHFDNMKFIITKSNCDNGGKNINDRLQEYCKDKKNFVLVESLGMKRYLSALKHAKLVIGNSSSGILEAPLFHVPTINIGNRQEGRMQAESIINCLPDELNIVNAMKHGLTKEFAVIAQNCKQLYGDGNTSRLITDVIVDFLINNKLSTKKPFYDIKF